MLIFEAFSSDNNNICAAQWADHQWKAGWLDNLRRLRTFIPATGTHPPGMTFPRTAWVRLNRLRTGAGRFRSCLHILDKTSSAACEFGAEEQTVDHVVLQCPIHRPPHGLHGLTVLDDETIGMAAQHLPRYLVWRNSRLKIWLIRRRRRSMFSDLSRSLAHLLFLANTGHSRRRALVSKYFRRCLKTAGDAWHGVGPDAWGIDRLQLRRKNADEDATHCHAAALLLFTSFSESTNKSMWLQYTLWKATSGQRRPSPLTLHRGPGSLNARLVHLPITEHEAG